MLLPAAGILTIIAFLVIVWFIWKLVKLMIVLILLVVVLGILWFFTPLNEMILRVIPQCVPSII